MQNQITYFAAYIETQWQLPYQIHTLSLSLSFSGRQRTREFCRVCKEK